MVRKCLPLISYLQGIDIDAFETDGVEDEDMANLSQCMENMSLSNQVLPCEIVDKNCAKQVEQLFQGAFLSTKVRYDQF